MGMNEAPRMRLLCGALLLLGAGAWRGAAAGQAPTAGKAPNVQSADYLFDPKFPKYCTSRITLRNPRKLRPLFLGGRGQNGILAFRPLDMERLGKIAAEVDLDNLAGLAELATASGAVSAQFDMIAAGVCDLDRFACADWLRQDVRPRFSFQVESLTQWKVHDAKRPEATEYQANLKARFSAGERGAEINTPAVVTIIAATPETTPHIVIRCRFALVGAELGLSGDDAGELQAAAMLAGYLNPSLESKALLDKLMAQQEKEAKDLLDKKVKQAPEDLDLDIDRKR